MRILLTYLLFLIPSQLFAGSASQIFYVQDVNGKPVYYDLSGMSSGPAEVKRVYKILNSMPNAQLIDRNDDFHVMKAKCHGSGDKKVCDFTQMTEDQGPLCDKYYRWPLHTLIACLDRRRRAYESSTTAGYNQLSWTFQKMNQLVPTFPTFSRFILRTNIREANWNSRGLAQLRSLENYCIDFQGAKKQQCDQLIKQVRQAWALFEAKNKVYERVRLFQSDLYKTHHLPDTSKQSVFMSYERPPNTISNKRKEGTGNGGSGTGRGRSRHAPKPGKNSPSPKKRDNKQGKDPQEEKDPKNRIIGDFPLHFGGGGTKKSNIDDIATASSGQSPLAGMNLTCPNFIPRNNCLKGGGDFDFTHYRIHSREIKTTNPDGSKSSHEQYFAQYHEDVGDIPLGTQSLGQFMDLVSQAVNSRSEDEVIEFMAELYLESYIQNSYLNSSSHKHFADRIGKLRQAISCLPSSSESNINKTLARYLDRNHLPLFSDGQMTRKRHQNAMAAGAHCLDQIISRWNDLRHNLGIDIETNRPVLKTEEINALPGGIRHLVNGATSLPVVRHFLREVPFMTNFSEQQSRECSLLQTRLNPTVEVQARESAGARVQSWSMSRKNYCTNMYTEFATLTHEMNEIYNRFPQLAEKTSNGQRVFQKITSQTPTPPQIKDYNLDFNTNWRNTYDNENDRLNSCFNRLTKDGELIDLDKEQKDSAKKPIRPYQEATNAYVTNSLIDEQLQSILNQFQQLCDPKRKADIISSAIRDQSFMEQYFQCDRKLYNTLFSAIKEPKITQKQATSNTNCNERNASWWQLCRRHIKDQASNIRDDVFVNMSQVGMDMLFVASPGVGTFAPTILRTGAAVAIGGGLGYILAPDTDELIASRQHELANFRSGHADIKTYNSATHALEELAKRDPEIEGMLTGMTMGLVFGVMDPIGGVAKRINTRSAIKTALETPEGAAQLQTELINLYRNLERKGAFNSTQGKTAKAQLLNLFKKNLAKRLPHVPDRIWQSLTPDEILSILNEEVPPPLEPRAATSVTVDPHKVLSSIEKGDVISYVTQDGRTVKLTVKSIDDGVFTFEQANGEVSKPQSPVDWFESLVQDIADNSLSVRSQGKNSAYNFNIPIEESPLFLELRRRYSEKFGVEIITGPEAAEIIRRQTNDGPAGLFVPGQPPRIYLNPGATMDTFFHEFRHLRQWQQAQSNMGRALGKVINLAESSKEGSVLRKFVANFMEADAELGNFYRQSALGDVARADGFLNITRSRMHALAKMLDELPVDHPSREAVELTFIQLREKFNLAQKRSLAISNNRIAEAVKNQAPSSPAPKFLRESVNFTETFKEHMLGEIADSGGGDGSQVLNVGMHTQQGLSELLKAVPELTIPKEGQLPIQSRPLPNGVTRLYVPRQAFKRGTWNKLQKTVNEFGLRDDMYKMAGQTPQEKGRTPYVPKTLFPENWSVADIQVAANYVVRTATQGTELNGGTIYTGTYRGVKLEVITRDGEIQTSFPSWDQ